jgi:hypothetical protein
VFVWAVLLDGLGWSDVLNSVWYFKENYIGNRGGRGVGLVWFLFCDVCWTLWINRNDLVFNNKIISSPRALIFSHFFNAALDGGEYRCRQSSTGANDGGNQDASP